MQFSKTFRVSAASTIATFALVAAPALASAHSDVDLLAKVPAAVTGVLISTDGTVAVGGAKVTATASDSVTAQSSWGNTLLTWVVKPASTVKYLGASALADIKVGDLVSFTGKLDSTQSGLVVAATAIRDLSAPATTTPKTIRASVTGTISSVNPGANSFVLATEKKGSVTVNTTASTTLMRNGSTITLANISAGETATVVGTMSSASSTTLSALKIVLPAKKKNDNHDEAKLKFWTHIEKLISARFSLNAK